MKVLGLLAFITLVLFLGLHGFGSHEGSPPSDSLGPDRVESHPSFEGKQLPPAVAGAAVAGTGESGERRAVDAEALSADLALLQRSAPGKLHFELELTVLDGHNRPVSGALLEIFMGGKDLDLQQESSAKGTTRRALEGGKVMLYDVPAGQLWARAEGRRVLSPAESLPFVVTEDAKLVVRIGGLLAIHGRVLLGVPEPLTLRLTRLPTSGSPRLGGEELLITSLSQHLSSEKFYFGGLEPGTYELQVMSRCCGGRKIKLCLPEESGALEIALIAKVDVLVDVRYRSGRAPDPRDIQLVPLALESAGESRGVQQPVTSRMVADDLTNPRVRTKVNLPTGRFLFENMDPGEYMLTVRPRHDPIGAGSARREGPFRGQFPLTIPPQVTEFPLLELLLDEPIQTTVRVTFSPLGERLLPLDSWLSAILDPSVNVDGIGGGLGYGELLTVAQGGELVLDLGPVFPGSHELHIEFPDPRVRTGRHLRAGTGRVIEFTDGELSSNDLLGGGPLAFLSRLSREELEDLMERTENWSTPWNPLQLQFVLEPNERQRELTVSL